MSVSQAFRAQCISNSEAFPLKVLKQNLGKFVEIMSTAGP